tara:strand:+ start:87 stop:650 length:564 start_codon:yes stop_codon:yes gene_type:complete
MSCPKGVICLEQYTILFISLLLFCILYLIRDSTVTQRQIPPPSFTHHPLSLIPVSQFHPPPVVQPIATPGHSYTTDSTDTLLNPYSPPLQHNEHHTYKQVGYLKNKSMSDKLFPIFGKPSQIRRDKWYYYTTYDNIKVPIYHNNKNCSDEQGCDSLYNSDVVTIENLSDSFNVSMYKNATLSYIPQI